MKKYITDKITGISYTLVGDVYIPNLVLADKNYEIGYWDRKHKEYIKQHKPSFYTTMLTQCKLNSYLADIEQQAQDLFLRLVKDLAEKENVTEELKSTDMMLWVRNMNNIRDRVTEIVNLNLIFT